MIKGMRRNKTNGLMTVYVRVEDKEYKCILSYINMHHEGWIQSVILEEYVPGEANKLLIPI
jgi:DNA-binding cell septation regulator SpoVG